MLLLEHLWLFRASTYIPRKLNLFKLEWNNSSQKFDPVKQTDKVMWIAQSTLRAHLFIGFIVALQGFKFISGNQNTESFSFTKASLYALSLATMLVTQLQMRSCYKLAFEQCLFVNGLVHLEKQYNNLDYTKIKRKRNLTENINILICYGMLPSVTILYLTFIYGLHWINPCKPSLAGFFLLSECSQNGNISSPTTNKILLLFTYGIKILVFLVNHWAFATGLYVCAFIIVGIQILSTMSFYDLLDMFEQKSNSDFDEQTAYETGQMYRAMQQLCLICNQVQKGAVMSCTIFGGIIIDAMSTSIIIWIPWSRDNLFWLLSFGVTGINAGLELLIILGGMAGIYQKSCILLHRLQKEKSGIGQKRGGLASKWRKRFYRSCVPIKCEFGKMFFVDICTPIVSLDCANALTVNILLLVGETLLVK